jgi:hypothetical protein
VSVFYAQHVFIHTRREKLENQTETNTEKKIETISLKPTWSGSLGLLLVLWTEGNHKGKKAALEELTRMAKFADEYAKIVEMAGK